METIVYLSIPVRNALKTDKNRLVTQGKTVGECLANLEEQVPGIAKILEIRPETNIFLGIVNMTSEWLWAPVYPGCEINLY